MFTYNITHQGYLIGQASGRFNAFKFIQKVMAWTSVKGYWKGFSYMVDGRELYGIERA